MTDLLLTRKASLALCMGLSVAVFPPAAGAAPPPSVPRNTVPSEPVKAPQSVADLLERLSQIKSLQATFVESKKLALLRAPLKSSGVLYYLQPGRIVREVKAPEPSTVRIAPGSLLIVDRAGERQIDLKGRPDLQMFVESFTRVLSGDKAALSKHYRLAFEHGKGAAWVLTLEPLGKPLNQLIAHIKMHGRGQQMSRLTVAETRGDKTETILTNVELNLEFSAEQRSRLFGLSTTVSR